MRRSKKIWLRRVLLIVAIFVLLFYVFYQKNADIEEFLLRPHEKRNYLENRENSHVQQVQHRVVYEILRRKMGFFLDMGAHEGEVFSQTLWLERQHDWTGLIIEANPVLCEKVDLLKRHAWRLCACLSDAHKSVTLVKGGKTGGFIDHNDDPHIESLGSKNKITVHCFSLGHVLKFIGVYHIDFIYLDVEIAGIAILKSIKYGLNKGIFTVDVFSIEYRVWDDQQIVVEKTKEKLNVVRRSFNELGSYFEYSQLITQKTRENSYMPIVFVRSHTWCKIHESFPNGTKCSEADKATHIKKYLLPPYYYKATKNADKHYSQAKQDEVVYDIVKKEDGFFVDIGAFDGQLFSNSLWLERKHNWTGLLIEANPDLCAKIDKLKRHAWRMCACLSDTLEKVYFIKGEALGGVQKEIDEHHIKLLDKENKVIVPCFSLETALNEIKRYHIDYFSLDVEGAEILILESLRKGLVSKRFTVDVWTIEYRVWDGKIVFDKSLEKLNALRKYFQEIGGYTEHSQIQYENVDEDGQALDVVFVRNEMFCKKYEKLPDGKTCPTKF